MKYIIIAFLIWMLPNVNVGAFTTILPVKHVFPGQTTHVLTRQELLWMYTMKTRFWSDGTRITVFYHKVDSRIHKDFCNEILGITTDRFNGIVQTYLTKGNANYYKQVNSDAEMVHSVASNPGSIGYVSTKEVLINAGGSVERLMVAM